MNYENREAIYTALMRIDHYENKIELLNKLDAYLKKAHFRDISIIFALPNVMSNHTQIDVSDSLESVKNFVDSYKGSLQHRIREEKDKLKDL